MPTENDLEAVFEEGYQAGLKSAQHGWRPIETAPRDEICDFWIEWADGCGPGRPLGETPYAHRQRFRGKFGGWSSVEKATHWMPLPEPPAGKK